MMFGILLFIGMIFSTGAKANLPQTNALTQVKKETMLYDINWKVEFNNNGQKTELTLIDELEIINSVSNLTDVATISLPETIMNTPLNFEDKIGKGTEVVIQLGYNDDIRQEFKGFVNDIVANNSTLQIKCEDAIFLFRKPVKNVELKEVGLKEIAQHLVDQVDTSFKVESDYNITYEKFTIRNATAYDVLKKLQEETKGNIYFDTENKTLHIHPPYVQKTGQVYYSMQKNVETSSLEYKNRDNEKTEVIVESTGKNGKVKKYKAGTTGGHQVNIKVGPMTDASIKILAEAVLTREARSRYEGTFDTWLVPYVAPGYSARIKDEDYPDKTSTYYTVAVTTKISRNGGVRTVTPGIKLS